MGIVILLLAVVEVALGGFVVAQALLHGWTEMLLMIGVLLIGFGISHVGIAWLIAMGSDWMKMAESDE